MTFSASPPHTPVESGRDTVDDRVGRKRLGLPQLIRGKLADYTNYIGQVGKGKAELCRECILHFWEQFGVIRRSLQPVAFEDHVGAREGALHLKRAVCIERCLELIPTAEAHSPRGKQRDLNVGQPEVHEASLRRPFLMISAARARSSSYAKRSREVSGRPPGCAAIYSDEKLVCNCCLAIAGMRSPSSRTSASPAPKHDIRVGSISRCSASTRISASLYESGTDNTRVD